MGNIVRNTQQRSFVVLLNRFRFLQQRRPLISGAMLVLSDTPSLPDMTGFTAVDSLPLLQKFGVPRIDFIYWQSQLKQFREWLQPLQITLLQLTSLRYYRSHQYRHHRKSS